MPSKKKKYNARFPAGRIKKIMQSDEEVGKVAQAVPVIISRTVELFIESLLEKTFRITKSRNAKTLSPSHMKQCIMSENRFDFLRELVKEIPDISVAEEAEQDLATPTSEHSQQSYNFNMPSTSCSVIVQPTVNGSSLKNGTIQQRSRSVSSLPTPDSVPLSFPPKIQNSTDLKRTREIAPRTPEFSPSTIIRANFYKENTDVQNMPDAMDPPPKLCRTDSAPPNVSFQNDNTIATVIKKPHRRLQHQSKSIPCTSKETLQPPTVPPPIINIDVCNTPIVKIDYSNLTIPDTDSVEPSFKKKKDPSTNTSNSPIINIDLSKIAAQFSTNPLPAPPQLQTNNALDLDEDYDNI